MGGYVWVGGERRVREGLRGLRYHWIDGSSIGDDCSRTHLRYIQKSGKQDISPGALKSSAMLPVLRSPNAMQCPQQQQLILLPMLQPVSSSNHATQLSPALHQSAPACLSR